jgi:hypothetical protein
LAQRADGSATTLGEAAQLAGMTERAIRYGLKKENIRDWLREHVRSTLSAGAVSAARTMLSLLRSENSMSQFRAAAWIAGLNGIAPVDNRGPLVNVNVGAGYVLDLRPPAERGGPISKEDAAQLSPIGGVLLGSRREAPLQIEGEATEVAAPADEWGPWPNIVAKL